MKAGRTDGGEAGASPNLRAESGAMGVDGEGGRRQELLPPARRGGEMWVCGGGGAVSSFSRGESYVRGSGVGRKKKKRAAFAFFPGRGGGG